MKKRIYFENIMIAIVVFLYLLIGINYGLNVYDEANPLVGAMRINNGQLPYLDFWSMYAPGQYYLTAGILKIFGNNILTIKIISALFMMILSLYVYKIADLYYERKYSLSVLFLIIVYGAWYGMSGRGILTALMLLIAGLYYFLNSIMGNKSTNAYFSGVLWGLAIAFRHDFVAYIGFMLIVYCINRLINKDKQVFKTIFKCGFSFLIIGAIPYLVLLHYVGFANMYEQLFRMPSQVFAAYRGLNLCVPLIDFKFSREILTAKYFIAEWKCFAYYMPFLIIVISILSIFKNYRLDYKKNEIGLLIITMLALALLNQGRVRCDFEHVVPSVFLSFILIPYLLNSIRDKNKRIIIYTFVFIFLAVPPMLVKMNYAVRAFNLNGTEYLNVLNAESISIDAQWQKHYKKTIEYIKENTKSGERIFICNTFNDRITINDMMLYYLTQRMPASKYHELHPGVATEDYAQKEIIKDLISNKTKMIIKVANNYSPEPNKSSISGSKRLDNYINLNYELVEQFGDYSILKAKGNF